MFCSTSGPNVNIHVENFFLFIVEIIDMRKFNQATIAQIVHEFLKSDQEPSRETHSMSDTSKSIFGFSFISCMFFVTRLWDSYPQPENKIYK